MSPVSNHIRYLDIDKQIQSVPVQPTPTSPQNSYLICLGIKGRKQATHGDVDGAIRSSSRRKKGTDKLFPFLQRIIEPGSVGDRLYL